MLWRFLAGEQRGKRKGSDGVQDGTLQINGLLAELSPPSARIDIREGIAVGISRGDDESSAGSDGIVLGEIEASEAEEEVAARIGGGGHADEGLVTIVSAYKLHHSPCKEKQTTW
jgi:hypothetical protein